ncbi:hypothetical protein CPT_Ponderosa_003 [Stenotrophomonas phage Ponderosa]|uniref:Uncharacterized protein n=1 Tax=Stenotrophomonas phage Ponderosa TaxID=2591103 RepID=A0A5B9NCH4_9CAUD|nr:hypothetical protein CPT_Ponderosa_003 [Stenotrophomonas phage Ponderosa]
MTERYCDFMFSPIEWWFQLCLSMERSLGETATSLLAVVGFVLLLPVMLFTMLAGIVCLLVHGLAELIFNLGALLWRATHGK